MKTILRTIAAISFAVGGTIAHSAERTVLSFSDLIGWDSDNHAAAFGAFLETCRDLRNTEWRTLCSVAQQNPTPKMFFETFFRPILVHDGNEPLFTGYYESELKGSLTRGGKYQYPLYAVPPEVVEGEQWASRKEIESEGILKNRGLEIAWVDNPLDAYFLQIQGSGRVILPDGRKIRLGYGAENGHAYKSIGKELIRQEIFEEHEASTKNITDWIAENPQQGRELLWHNPSYVFFRRVDEVPTEKGPLGAMNRSITSLRSVAVDPKYTPLGTTVWIEKDGALPVNRLFIAQDTGGAIKGARRADIFFGTGDAAGIEAGKVRDGGRLNQLWPIELAFAVEGIGEN